jgi:Uma2 family endonuclease
MAQVAHSYSPVPPQKPAPKVLPSIPPLVNGDHLTRAEFERRYDATPGLKKAELIEGKVYVSPPVSHGFHGRPHVDMGTIFGVYRAATPGVEAGDNGSIRLDLDNMPQPDLYLLIDSALGGQAKIDADNYVVGAPDLIAEIAATSAAYDLHEKLRVYRRNGVREYIVLRTIDGEMDYFVLREGDYRRITPAADGCFHSEIFPGLWIDAPALLRGDLATALRQVQQGIASAEHNNYVSSLQSKIQTKPTS